jgi:hypothetical protein
MRNETILDKVINNGDIIMGIAVVLFIGCMLAWFVAMLPAN